MNRDDALNFLIVWAVNLIFLGFVALFLWPFGELALAGRLALGNLLLLAILLFSASLVFWIERIFRIDMDRNFDAYVILNLLASLPLMLGWSAFAAMVIGGRTVSSSWGIVAVLYVIGLLSVYLAASLVTTIYTGGLYRIIGIPAALLGFVLFVIWPASGQFLYGWFFDLF